MSAFFDLFSGFLPAQVEEQRQKEEERGSGGQGGGCSVLTTSPCRLLFSDPPCPLHQSTRSRSHREAPASGFGNRYESHRAKSPACKRRKTTRGYLQLGCKCQQCHHRHVMPNRRCTDAFWAFLGFLALKRRGWLTGVNLEGKRVHFAPSIKERVNCTLFSMIIAICSQYNHKIDG